MSVRVVRARALGVGLAALGEWHRRGAPAPPWDAPGARTASTSAVPAATASAAREAAGDHGFSPWLGDASVKPTSMRRGAK